MSEVYHGVLFRVPDGADHACELFIELDTNSPLRLVAFNATLMGVYAPKGEAPFEEFQRVAAQLSAVTGIAVIYFYDSRVDYIFEIFENGQLVQSNNEDLELIIDPFGPLEASELTDADIESVFMHENGNILLTA